MRPKHEQGARDDTAGQEFINVRSRVIVAGEVMLAEIGMPPTWYEHRDYGSPVADSSSHKCWAATTGAIVRGEGAHHEA